MELSENFDRRLQQNYTGINNQIWKNEERAFKLLTNVKTAKLKLSVASNMLHLGSAAGSTSESKVSENMLPSRLSLERSNVISTSDPLITNTLSEALQTSVFLSRLAHALRKLC